MRMKVQHTLKCRHTHNAALHFSSSIDACESSITWMAQPHQLENGLLLLFVVAFLSYACQSPGLYGCVTCDVCHLRCGTNKHDKFKRRRVDGILPLVATETAWLARIHDLIGLPLEHLLNALCVLASVLCLSAIFSGIGKSLALLVGIAVYRAVADNGQVFLSFQWEQLLLEAAFIGLLLFPWFGKRPSRLRSALGTWLLRFMLFKLMFMSGIVKLQADCPTWVQLTATEYHYATQPLPTALAQFARFMPQALHRFSVALTLMIEIPAAALILIPLKHTIWLGCMLQVCLQVLIFATGNYTFFNLLTLGLSVACSQGATLDSLAAFRWLDCSTSRSLQRACIFVFLWGSSLFMFTHGPVQIQTDTSPQLLWHVQVSPRMLQHNLEQLLADYLPAITWTAGGVVVAMSVLSGMMPPRVTEHIDNRQKDKLGSTKKSHHTASSLSWLRAVLSTVVCLLAGNALLPASMGALLTLHMPSLQATPLLLQRLQVAQQWRIASGYGLFRVMTGVGQPPPRGPVEQQLHSSQRAILQAATQGANQAAAASLWPHFTQYESASLAWDRPGQWLSNVWGVATSKQQAAQGQSSSPLKLPVIPGWTDAMGIPLAVVSRPEIIMQGRAAGKPAQTLNISFGYKPGELSCTPQLVAPHQPRLDWQMWFAALGSYQQAPWAVLLLQKLLQGSPHVVQLLASPHSSQQACGGRWPFGWKNQTSLQQLPPVNMSTSNLLVDWQRWLLPPANMVNAPIPVPPHSMQAVVWEYDFVKPALTGMQAREYESWKAQESGTVWRRRNPREWLPSLTRHDASLQDFVRSIGAEAVLSRQATKHAQGRAWCRRVLHRLPTGSEPCVGAPILRRVLSVLGMAPHSDVDGVWLLDWWVPLHGNSGLQELLPAALRPLFEMHVPLLVPMYGRWTTADSACFAVSPNQWQEVSRLGSLLLCFMSNTWAVIANAPASVAAQPAVQLVKCASWQCSIVQLYLRAWHLLRWSSSALKVYFSSSLICLVLGFGTLLLPAYRGTKRQ